MNLIGDLPGSWAVPVLHREASPTCITQEDAVDFSGGEGPSLKSSYLCGYMFESVLGRF